MNVLFLGAAGSDDVLSSDFLVAMVYTVRRCSLCLICWRRTREHLPSLGCHNQRPFSLALSDCSRVPKTSNSRQSCGVPTHVKAGSGVPTATSRTPPPRQNYVSKSVAMVYTAQNREVCPLCARYPSIDDTIDVIDDAKSLPSVSPLFIGRPGESGLQVHPSYFQ